MSGYAKDIKGVLEDCERALQSIQACVAYDVVIELSRLSFRSWQSMHRTDPGLARRRSWGMGSPQSMHSRRARTAERSGK